MMTDEISPGIRPLRASLIVAISSGSIMIIELVASRMIATRMGVSLHTWTSVIGVIMAGISIGNYLGGRLADRRASLRLLGTVMALASLSSLLILWLNNDLHELKPPATIPLMIWVLGYVVGVFLLPSLCLGCVSPIVVKLSLSDLQRRGSTVGRIYAWSSVGSIVGTFATGWALIRLLGTKNTILLVASLLMLLALLFSVSAGRWRAWLRAGLWLGLFGVSLFLLWRTGFLASECLRETNYYCINIKEVDWGEGQVRELLLDRLVHSYSDIDDPTHLIYGYERTYAAAVFPLLGRKPALDAFFIGGGGYTFPRFLEAIAPQSHVVVAEIDPDVTEAAHLWLGLARDARMEIHHLDARNYLLWDAAPDSYDVVFGDAFNDYAVPFHLTTLEFDQLVDRALREDGIYLVNIIDGGRHGHFMRAYVRTVQQVFKHVAVIPSTPGWREAVRTTFVVAASQQPLQFGVPDDVATASQQPMDLSLPAEYRPLDSAELQRYLDQEEPLVLTDDHVPVDNLMAPVVESSFYDFTLTPDIVARILPRVIAIGSALGVMIVFGLAWALWRRRRRARIAFAELDGGHDDPTGRTTA